MSGSLSLSPPSLKPESHVSIEERDCFLLSRLVLSSLERKYIGGGLSLLRGGVVVGVLGGAVAEIYSGR